ncbi:DUF4326 domain-containing protein [Micromonospora sp. NPDC047465]|uniref:DUF4326 domain-containing protein n=1 Tax=Micromonospora sp. NPDC047465 TaxID=3154813 RepID=UPI0033C5B34C
MTAPKRIQRKRTAGWRMPENTVYVGRPSHWGNPYRTDTPTVWGVRPDGTRYRIDRVLTPAEAVELYRITETWGDWLPVFTAAVRRELAGKNLACWCPLDQPCHADVLLEIANAPAVIDVALPGVSR